MRNRKPRKGGLEQAIQAAGDMVKLANLIGLTVQAVAQWSEVPPERCLSVEAATGVSRHVLRPDIYGDRPVRPVSARGNESRAAA